LIGTVALQAVIAACRWRRHELDFTAWLTSEATQNPGNVEICPVRTTDTLAPVSGSRQLACGVARARQETNSDISLLCRGPGIAVPLCDGYTVTPRHLYSFANAAALVDHAAGNVLAAELLDELAPDWREAYKSEYEVFLAADGQFSLRSRRGRT